MAMVSEQQLERCFELGLKSFVNEAQFFTCLLNAMVYVHAPVSDDSKNVRLIQFRHPDGFDAIPFFTSETKARFAGRGVARTVKVTGRDLLEGTRGATLMLNPNDGGCVLYPEEVNALLRTGTVAQIEKIHLDNDFSFMVIDQANPPIWLMPRLIRLYEQLPFVLAAYLLEVAPTQALDNRGLLIALCVAAEYAERAIRATINEIGFYPVITDTYEKADPGHEECSCRSEGSSALSSSVVRSSRQASRVSAVRRWRGNWGSGTPC